MKAELEQVKIQRDIALRRQKKLEDAVKDLRKLVESNQQFKFNSYYDKSHLWLNIKIKL